MKILGLKFKNINALQGTWEIRFDQPPLADAGLFAIVGPNGSGKTSILDALTLSLYGETARMKDPDPGVVNRQDGDSHSEVTFSVGGSLYRSQWSIRKNADGPEAPQMALISVNGQETILEDRVIKVRERVAELTGLDFKRFCRSILLAQGEFTAFLNGLESERSEILEKIMGPELTQDIQESIRTHAEAENEKLLQLKEAADSCPQPDREQIKALQEALDQAEEDFQETDRLLQDLKSDEEWLNRLDLLEAEQNDAAETLTTTRARAAQLSTDLQRLELAQKAAPFQDDVARLEELRVEASSAAAALNDLEVEIKSHQDQVAELEEQLQKNQQRLDEAQRQQEDRSEDIQKAKQLDHAKATANTRFLELVSRYETVERELKEKLQQQTEAEQQTTETRDRHLQLQNWLDENSADGRLATDLPVIEQILARLKETRKQRDEHETRRTLAKKDEQRAARALKRVERSTQKVRKQVDKLAAAKAERDRHMDELLASDTPESLSTQYRDQKTRLAAFKKLGKIGRRFQQHSQGEDIRGTLSGIQSRLDSLAQSLPLEQSRLSELEETVGWGDAVKKYAGDRSLLKSGQPCPLCGALDHPFVQQGVPELQAPNGDLQAQREKVEALQKELKALGAKAAELQPKAQVLNTFDEAWTKACAQAGVQWTIPSPQSVLEQTHTIKADMAQLKSRIRAVRWLDWRASWGERFLQSKSEKLSLRERESGKLRSTYESQLKTLSELEAKLESLDQNKRALRDELDERLKELGESLPRVKMEKEMLQRMRHRWAEYRRQQLELEKVGGQLTSLEASLKSLPQDLILAQEQKSSLSAEIETTQQQLSTLKEEGDRLFGTSDPLQESQNLEYEISLGTKEQLALSENIESLRMALSEREPLLPQAMERAKETKAAVDHAEQEVLALSTPEGFPSVDALMDSVRLLGRKESIMDQWDAAGKALTEAESRLQTANTALEAARSERVVKGSVADVRREISEAEKRRDLLREDIEAAQFPLEDQRRLERRHREALQAVAEQEKVYAWAMDEQKALQSRDPLETRSKLQRLMMERLLDRTNQHLEELNGRYHLRPLSDEGLGFHVEDALQGGACRSTRTLSGGESFLVSLCLALGLAEMAAKDRKIESLFLDEGFGALDDEMLYKVMAALKGLQANGRMVGVISHVKRLADEIPTQIRLEKQPGGRSQLRIVA